MILIHMFIAMYIIFSIHPCRWDCTHEQTAFESYTKVAKESHHGFEVSIAGLLIDEKWPFVGSSPDGIIKCMCCGKVALEIKCPFASKMAYKKETKRTFVCHRRMDNGPSREITHTTIRYKCKLTSASSPI